MGMHRLVQDDPHAEHELMAPHTARTIERIATATSIGLGLLLTITVMTVAWPRVTSALGIERTAPAPTTAYEAGTIIDTPDAWHRDAPYTLVLFARSSCGACQTASPYLKTLVGRVRAKGAVVLAGSEQARDEDAAYARGLGLTGAEFRVTPAGLRVRATPTLVLVNREGRILGTWEGVGKEDRQASITQAIDVLMK